ncbi:MAG: hypothetical protein WBP81_32965 [Solirubrobacteraceae bacterium]
MSGHQEPQKLTDDDGKLVDLVKAVLVDPDLHTDTRMRLTNEIRALLRSAPEAASGAQASEAHQRSPAGDHHQLAELLDAVLVDPNLHTDTRMRLYREISESLRRLDRSAVRTDAPR